MYELKNEQHGSDWYQLMAKETGERVAPEVEQQGETPLLAQAIAASEDPARLIAPDVPTHEMPAEQLAEIVASLRGAMLPKIISPDSMEESRSLPDIPDECRSLPDFPVFQARVPPPPPAPAFDPPSLDPWFSPAFEPPLSPALEPAPLMARALTPLPAPVLRAPEAPPLEHLFAAPSRSILAELESPLDARSFEASVSVAIPTAPPTYGRSLSMLQRTEPAVAMERKRKIARISVESRERLQAMARERISREIAARPRLIGQRARPRFSVRALMGPTLAFLALPLFTVLVLLAWNASPPQPAELYTWLRTVVLVSAGAGAAILYRRSA